MGKPYTFIQACCSNNNCFPAHDELGLRETSLVSPKQSVPSILVCPSDATFMTVT